MNWLRDRRWLLSVGFFSLAVSFVCLNVLANRFYRRWDLTSAQLYSLSPATTERLQLLDKPVEVVVFMAQGDPLLSSVKTLLDAYQEHTRLLIPKYLDPDRNPAEFVARQQEYGVFEGKTENGRIAAEASIVLVQEDRRWFITTDDIITYDEEDHQAQPQLEQSLTEGLANVVEEAHVDVCFTQGQQELSTDSGGPQGLREFRQQLERNNYHVHAVSLLAPRPSHRLAECDLVIVAGPAQPFSEEAGARLAGYARGGGNLLLALGPMADEDGRIQPPRLGNLLQEYGVKLNNNLVFESDPAQRMPVGFGGEVFLATPRSHRVTEGLLRGGRVQMPVLLQLSQGLSKTDDSKAVPLLQTSHRAFSLDSFGPLRSPEAATELQRAQQHPRREYLALAAEHQQQQGTSAERPGRLLVLGSASLLWASTWLDPGLLGTKRFVENGISWLSSRPALVSVPSKPKQAAGLNLTEESMSAVQRYVLLYMPLCAALLGALVLWRRRLEDSEGDYE